MKAFIAVIFAAIALVLVSAQEANKENLQGSEALYLSAPYGAYNPYGAYPYSAIPAPAAAPVYPPVPAAYPAPSFYYR